MKIEDLPELPEEEPEPEPEPAPPPPTPTLVGEAASFEQEVGLDGATPTAWDSLFNVAHMKIYCRSYLLRWSSRVSKLPGKTPQSQITPS